MMFMTRLHTDSMQVNRHEGFCDQPSKKTKKEDLNYHTHSDL